MLVARRTWAVWGLVAAIVLALLAGAGVVCWFKLPRWAPDWVIEHSPFVEPVVRAWAGIRRLNGTPASEGGFPGVVEDLSGSTLARFGASAEPTLRRLVRDGDGDVRLQAFLFHHRFDAAELNAFTADGDPWLRLAAWGRLEGMPLAVRYLPPPDPAAPGAVVHGALDLLGDGDAYIRERVQDALRREESLPWPVRLALYDRLVHPRERGFLIPLLAGLCDHERWRAGEDAGPVPLPADVLFPLLDLGRGPAADAGVHEFIRVQLGHVAQDFAALSSRFAAMRQGTSPWPPGAEPWMAERLRLLMERRVSFALEEVDLDVAIAERFAGANVLIDPWVIAAAPPPVTLELRDARVIDALLALTRATGTHLHLAGDAVLVVGPQAAACDGFVPLPAIGLAPGFDRMHPAFADRQARLQAKHDLVCVDVPFAQAVADLARRSGVPIGSVEPEEPLSIDLRQVSLDHAIRLIARLRRLVAVQDAAGIHLHPEQ